jgi:acyl carrier protein
MIRQDAVNLVLRCLAEVLKEDAAAAVAVDEDFVLMGPHAGLDSIRLVELIADLEQTLKEQHGLEVQLADERALSQEQSPYRSVSALAEYICLLAVEQESRV